MLWRLTLSRRRGLQCVFMSELLRLAEAHRLIHQQLARLGSERIALDAAMGRVLAGEIRSAMALPSFDHAAMDGYALHATPRQDVGSEHAVHGSQAAGDPARQAQGDAWEIMTGARLPHGLDAVVPLERTQLLKAQPDGAPARIRLLDALSVGANVRLAGSDVAHDAPVLAAGACIGPAQIMLLAALGVGHVEVVRRPRVAIICTGKELQTDSAVPLADGRIYSSNGPYLVAALGAAGAQVLFCDTVDDTSATYAQALQRAVEASADMVISTGAVSMGRYDFVPATLRGLQAEILFHKLAIRPGRPLLCARLAHGPLVIALPGTPMAVSVGLRFVIAPALRLMNGQGDEPMLRAVLDTPQQPKPGLRHFLRAQLHQDGGGQLHAVVPGQQQPFRIQPFANADAWVVLPEDAGDCPAGTLVEVASLQPGTMPSIGSVPHGQSVHDPRA
jgi:molybdopterin molybdotransferase